MSPRCLQHKCPSVLANAVNILSLRASEVDHLDSSNGIKRIWRAQHKARKQRTVFRRLAMDSLNPDRGTDGREWGGSTQGRGGNRIYTDTHGLRKAQEVSSKHGAISDIQLCSNKVGFPKLMLYTSLRASNLSVACSFKSFLLCSKYCLSLALSTALHLGEIN